MTVAGDRERSSASSAVRTVLGLAARLARQWWPHLASLAAACGIVAVTIAGALGVGDSLTQGLRRLALARLGGIQAAVLADGFVRADLAAETEARMSSRSGEGAAGSGPVAAGHPAGQVVPAVVLEVTLEAAADAGRPPTAARATLLACDALPRLGFPPATATFAADTADTVAVNQTLADSLGVGPGAAVVLRITKVAEVPGDSPLGRRTAASWSRRLRVAEVLPVAGLGGFSLRPTQVTGGLVVTSLATAQATLRRSAPVANVLFAVAGPDAAARPEAAAALHAAVAPTLDDLGCSFDRPAEGAPWRLSCRRLLLAPEADAAAEKVLRPLGASPSLVFLANAMTPLVGGLPGKASIPYSTVVGIDSTSLPVGELVDDQGRLLPLPGPDEIVIDRWMADDLAAQGVPVEVGDPLEVRSFLPETLHGRVEEAAHTFRISGIAALRGAAVARDLVPTVEGITDEASIADWDPPFPFDRSRVRVTAPHDEDDAYWRQHGATPKAFVSLAAARRLAGSRFGVTTAWHVPAPAVQSPDALRASLAAAMPIDGMGMRVVPLRAEAEAAARGSTPFGSLFLALSSFVVAAGLLLEWLLFSLLVAARRRDIGILAACGWPASQIMVLLIALGAAAAGGGVLIGTLSGPLWAQALLAWLGQAWTSGVAAGSSAAFGGATARMSPGVFVPAAVAAALVSLAAVALAARRAARQNPLGLLKGKDADAAASEGRSGWGVAGLAAAGPVAAAGLAAWAGRGDPQLAVGLFFAAGAAALIGLLAGVRLLLGRSRPADQPLRTLAGLAWSGLRQGRSRAFSVAAIVACAEFLIVAVSSFSLQPPPRPHDRDSPTGGWTFLASFGTATGIDPADPVERDALGLSDDARSAIAECTIARIRSSAGDDASCVNLYAPTQPTLLGVGASFIDRGGFRFVDHAPLASASPAGPAAAVPNPWRLLERGSVPAAAGQPDGAGGLVETAPLQAAAPVPVIIDQATAQWALKLGGVGSRFDLPIEGGVARFEIVGLLEPGILQGFLIVSERSFERLFPRRSGYAMALVDAGPTADAAREARVAGAISSAWADAAATVTRTIDRLRSLQAVQNTFLSGFQALGTLGLLLGAAGVAAVQFQSVLERQPALGLMAAVGFTTARLRLVVVLETLLMVGLGLAVGTLAGCLAVVPSLVSGRAAVPIGWLGCTWAITGLAAVAAGLAAARRVVRLQPGRILAAAR